MSFESWAAFYASDAQAVYAPLVAPALFLLVRLVARSPSRPGVAPESARFVRVYAVVFAVETLLDPLATGPLVRAAGLYGGSGGRAVLLPFVLLGDFRVFLLVFALAAPAAGVARAAGAAGLATLVVPAFALGANAALEWIAGDLHENSIWLAYELSFVAMALYLRFRFVPAHVGADRPELRGYLRAINGYVAIY